MFIAMRNSYTSKLQIPGGLSVVSWLIEPSILCKVPGIFDMCIMVRYRRPHQKHISGLRKMSTPVFRPSGAACL